MAWDFPSRTVIKRHLLQVSQHGSTRSEPMGAMRITGTATSIQMAKRIGYRLHSDQPSGQGRLDRLPFAHPKWVEYRSEEAAKEPMNAVGHDRCRKR